MAHAEVFVALLIAVVLVALAARRFERVPHAVALVVGGLVAGLLPFAPKIHLDPEVIFVAFLPPILYPSAFTFAFEDVRPNLRPIGFLAVGLVLATVAGVAAAAHLLAGLPWAAAFVLGAVISPTDPVAATAIIRSSGAPQRLATILEGESLINDGTALTALKIAIAAVGGSFSLGTSAGKFVVIAAGGAAVGAVLGWMTAHLRRRVDDLALECTMAVLLAYGSFIVAERVGVSGVLAVVAAGFVMGRSGEISGPETRVGGESFWLVAMFLAESILFLLVGIAFADVVDDPASQLGHVVTLTAAAVAAAVVVRFAWELVVPKLVRSDTTVRERVVLGFTGLRGALSVAAALSIPAAVGGQAFPDRSAVVAAAIAAIVVLLVAPALLLPPVLSMAGLLGSDDSAARERRARQTLAEVALERADELAAEWDLPEEVVQRVRERYELRLRRYASSDPHDEPDDDERLSLYRRLYREITQAERSALTTMRRGGEVHGQLLRDLERELDIDALRSR